MFTRPSQILESAGKKGKVDIRLVDTGALGWTVAVNADQALDRTPVR